MSVWGPEPLENDDALDWLSEIESAPDVVALNDAFDDVLSRDSAEYLEVSEVAAAICAAMLVAALVAESIADTPLSEAAARHMRQSYLRLLPSARLSLVRRAARSLRACADGSRSELHEMTHEIEPLGRRWLDGVDALRRRLDAVTADIRGTDQAQAQAGGTG
jgi:Domain of unknown function (DUF4259)